MKKILLSLAVIAFVGVAAVGATGAFYGDTETSTGNTFTAGSIELKVDSTSHYDGMICVEVDTDVYVWEEESTDSSTYPELIGEPCDGTWSETDLGISHKFFNYLDLKPGDWGEDTISLHVYDNDAWGQFVVTNVFDRDNTCTGPEDAEDAEDGECGEGNPDENGDMDENLRITAWLDQGFLPGFQCGDPELQEDCSDTLEGDNIYDEQYESPLIWDNELIGDLGPFDLADVLSYAYTAESCEVTDGDTNYDDCHGLALDGRMVGSTTYYFGLAWELPLATGNEVQSDEYTADLTFQVEQHRNNQNPFNND